MAKQTFTRVIQRKETETESTTSNSSSTFSRPTSNTVTRPSSSGTFTRPSTAGTEPRPTTNTVTRPSSSGTVTRPSTSSGRGTTASGRVDAPIGKGQYINTVEDTTSVETRYSIVVKDPGSYPEQVAEVVVGAGWRQVVSDLQTDISISNPEQQKDKTLADAAKVITLGAKIDVSKVLIVEFPFPGLKKGSTVTDKSELYIEYTIEVKSWGSSQSKVQELVLGKGASSNLQLSLPLKLKYPEWQKDQMMTLAQQLVDEGADISITKELTYITPLV